MQKKPPRLFVQVARRDWFRAWVADVQFVGSGEPKLKYPTASVYRTAFSTERISEAAILAGHQRQLRWF